MERQAGPPYGQSRTTRVRTDGKQFAVGGERFHFRGVTYGTFRPRSHDAERFPELLQIKHDLAAIQEAGFTVVRTYTAPTDELIEMAADRDLRVLAGVFYPDWRYLVGASRRQYRRIAADACREVRAAARRYRGADELVALCVGNEIPGDVVRWVGTTEVARMIERLVETVREEDPERLVTYANYPTTEYLPLNSLDFLTFNVFLESQPDFRRYLTRLQHLACDRPLVLGEIGLDARNTEAGEQRQAEVLEWQLFTALERGVAGTCVFSWTDEWWVGDAAVEGWHFGLTRQDRSPRPALDVVARANQLTARGLRSTWPSVSVVICAYNAASTLDECLMHTNALDYPSLEIIVVDDGSTDETAAIARRYPRARLVGIDHGGLSVARNAGLAAASGEIVAYLDSDAYPSPEWLYYLALAFDAPGVGGAGGPNVPPPGDPEGAQRVARAPGGPVHVLLSDDRAEHVPGCNMAFWRSVLIEVGGFDPIYTAAGDDVDLCWKVLDRGWEIGFHPAALVWHHRRSGLRAYLRQQRGYGKAEALVEARHPDRFTFTGSARWRGSIYDGLAPSVRRQRVYRGMFGVAPYQSVYRGGGYGLDVVHQAGVPAATLLIPSAAAAFIHPVLAVPALLSIVSLAALFAVDAARVVPPRTTGRTGRFRASVAVLDLMQPLVRLWGRSRHRTFARLGLPPMTQLPGPAHTRGRKVIVVPDDRPRAQLAAAAVNILRRAGLRAMTPTGWEDYDARVLASRLVEARLVTSSYPAGCVQIRLRKRLRGRPTLLVTAVAVIAALAHPLAGGLIASAAAIDAAQGWWRGGAFARRALLRSSNGQRALVSQPDDDVPHPPSADSAPSFEGVHTFVSSR